MNRVRIASPIESKIPSKKEPLPFSPSTPPPPPPPLFLSQLLPYADPDPDPEPDPEPDPDSCTHLDSYPWAKKEEDIGGDFKCLDVNAGTEGSLTLLPTLVNPSLSVG